MASDVESMALCAIRYTIGRRSYIVPQGQRWARKWGAKSQWVRDVIRSDLRKLAVRCDLEGSQFGWLGDKRDEAGWRAVLAELDAMAEAGDA